MPTLFPSSALRNLPPLPTHPLSLSWSSPELVERGASTADVRLQVLAGLQPLEERIRPAYLRRMLVVFRLAGTTAARVQGSRARIPPASIGFELMFSSGLLLLLLLDSSPDDAKLRSGKHHLRCTPQ